MAFVDYYKILGVDKNIPQKDVRAAYRKRAKQFHPDLHPNDPKAEVFFGAHRSGKAAYASQKGALRGRSFVGRTGIRGSLL